MTGSDDDNSGGDVTVEEILLPRSGSKTITTSELEVLYIS